MSRQRVSDPAATLAWLRTPQPVAAPKRFARDWGQMRYTRLMQSSRTHVRLAYLAGATCEIDGCTSIPEAVMLVFDHCHRHGWVRAVLCNAHNVRIAHLEAAWLEYGLDFTSTPYWPVLMACADCRDPRES